MRIVKQKILITNFQNFSRNIKNSIAIHYVAQPLKQIKALYN